MTISHSDSPHVRVQDPRSVPHAPARPTGPELMVPRGAVKVLVGLLRQTGGDVSAAAVLANRFAGGTNDPRYALLRGILEECDHERTVAAIGRTA